MAKAELIPWLITRNDKIIMTSGFARELEKITGDIGGLKSIAELLGWEYKVVKFHGRPVRAMVTREEDFMSFLV